MSSPNIKEARKCQACEGTGIDRMRQDECRICYGHGAVVTSVYPEEPPKTEADIAPRKVITPAADEFDFIAKRLRELEAERKPQGGEPQAVKPEPAANPYAAEQEDPFIYPDFY